MYQLPAAPCPPSHPTELASTPLFPLQQLRRCSGSLSAAAHEDPAEQNATPPTLGRQGLTGGWRAALKPANDLPSFCPWRKVSEEQRIPAGLLNTPEATLPLQEQEILCNTNVFIHTFSYAGFLQKPVFCLFNHSTPKHEFIDNLFAAPHHPCSPSWLS